MTLTRNEMILLLALADGELHNEPPTGLTICQYKKAAEDLKAKGLILAQIGSYQGEPSVSTQINDDGRATLDDMERDRKHYLFEILKKNDLTIDEYEMIKSTKEHGILENHWEWDDFDDKWRKLNQRKKCFEPVKDQHGVRTGDLKLNNNGIWLLEDIVGELASKLYNAQDAQHVDATIRTNEEEQSFDGVKLERLECLYLAHETNLFKEDAPARKIAAFISMLTGHSARTMRDDYTKLTARDKINETRKKEILDEFERKTRQ